MRSITVSRPTPAFLLALVALLFSMAGTGYAAAQISGKNLKKRSVPADRVVSNSLSGTQINESKLGQVPLSARALLADSAKSALSSEVAKVADVAKLADVAKTADTAKVADKALDAEKLGGRAPAEYLRSARTVRFVQASDVPINSGAERTASCEAGEVVVSGGGGWFISGTNTAVGSATISADYPLTNPDGSITGWRAEGKNTSAVARDFRAYVICAAG